MIIFILFSKDKNTFSECLEWLQNKKYNIVNLEILEDVYKIQLLPNNKSNLTKILIDNEKQIEALTDGDTITQIKQNKRLLKRIYATQRPN